MTTQSNVVNGSIQIAPGYITEQIVAGSEFHIANGVAFGPDGRLYVTSVGGESIFALNVSTGAVSVEVGPFAGEADDLVFTPDSDLISTAFLEGAVRRQNADGSKDDLATGLPGINSIALTRDGARLFAGQVFMGESLWEIDLAGNAAPRLVGLCQGSRRRPWSGGVGPIIAPSLMGGADGCGAWNAGARRSQSDPSAQPRAIVGSVAVPVTSRSTSVPARWGIGAWRRMRTAQP